MTPIYNFPEIKKGETFKSRFFWYGVGDETTFTPIDITGYTFCFQIRPTPNGKIIHQFDLVIADAVNGKVQIPSWDVDVEPGTYHYDVKYTDASGNSAFFFQGEFVILKTYSQCQ